VLELAGGILNTGSRRHIELIGGPGPVAVDLDRAVYLGDDTADPYVYAGYRINVPERSTDNVYVLGEVYHPREIELLPGDTPADLIAMAGGVTPRADTSAVNDFPATAAAGDVIMIPSTGAEGTGTLVIFGAVASPGLYRLEPNMSLSSLLEVAGGLTATANSARTTVFRMVPAEMRDLVDNRRYPVTVAASESASFTLLADDSVYVPTTLGFVRVAGAVRNPGLVPYKAGSSVNDYVQDAGGFVPASDRKNIQLTDRVSRITSIVGSAAMVHDGDIVTVKRREDSQ
jgi:protein involved in polysaccharide export with SLBB domain